MSAARYGVVGHPVAHSLSPQIHRAFAAQFGIALDYERLLAPLDDLGATVARFFADGGRGLNVTLPFKLDAYALCGERLSSRAREAGAVNWLASRDAALVGDNTDGVGLVRDLARCLGGPLAGLRVLLIGAGGAARGVVAPLVASRPATLAIVNRDAAKAVALAARFGAPVRATRFDALAHETFDVVVNATSASLAGAALPLPASVHAGARLVYDMMYGARPTPFLVDARAHGAAAVADGLGMLVEQAAESFRLWHGRTPDTAPVLALVRAGRVAA